MLRIPPPVAPPPRPTEVHAVACVNCPSVHFSPDPEARAILFDTDPRRLMESRFTCGWRPDKLCKGYHDKVCERLHTLDAEALV